MYNCSRWSMQLEFFKRYEATASAAPVPQDFTTVILVH